MTTWDPLVTTEAATQPEPRGKLPRVGDVNLRRYGGEPSQRDTLARIVLDEMYQFVGLLDADGNTLEINRADLRGAGVEMDQIRGTPF